MPEPRRQAGAASVPAYLAAFVVYVGLGLVVKSAVLNWLVGPLFLVIVLDVIPRLGRRLHR